MDVSAMFSSASADDAPETGRPSTAQAAVGARPARRPAAGSAASGPDDAAAPAVLDPMEMTPVQRIHAMREGRLEFPAINAGDPVSAGDAEDDSDTDPDDFDGSGGNSDSATGGGEVAQATEGVSADDESVDSGHDLSRFTDGLTAPVSGRDRLLSLFQRARGAAKRKPIVAAAAAVTAVGAVLYVSGVGRSSDNSEAPVVTAGSDSSSTQSPPSPAVIPIVNGPIKPVSAETSTEMCGDGSTPPMDGFSRDSSNAWACQTPFGFIPGIKMTITLPSMTALTEFSAIPGFNGKGADKKDNWPRFSLVSAVMLYFDDGSSKRVEFTPDRKSQSIQLGTADKPLYTRTVVMTVLEIKPSQPAAGGGSGSAGPSTTGAPSGGIFGDLGQWGERLNGGGSAGQAGPTGTSGAVQSAASSFAMSGITLTGHAAR